MEVVGLQQLQLQCKKCDEITPHTRKTPNHVLHALLTLFTVGIWVIPWILLAATSSFAGEAKCGKCGAMRPAT